MATAEYAYRSGLRSRGVVASAIVLSRPGILALVALAGYSGMVMAAGGLPDGSITVLTLLSLVLAAAGSAIINGVLDYPLDLKMARMQERIEAMEELGRSRALGLAAVLIAISMAIAFPCLNNLAALLILAAVIIYSLPYTLWFKRRSPFGAVPGGIPGALPVLVGYASVAGLLRPEALVLFVILLLWQPPHFWIFALKHREDYLNSGLPVLPVAVGSACANACIFLYVTALLPASLALGFFGGYSIWYQGAAAVLGVLFIVACYRYLVMYSLFGRAFRASIIYLFLLFLIIIAEICFVRATSALG